MRYLKTCSEKGMAASSMRGFVSALRWRHRLLDDSKNPACSKLVALALQTAVKLAPDAEPKDPFEHQLALYKVTRAALENDGLSFKKKRQAVFLYTSVLLAQRGLLRGDEVASLGNDECWLEDYKEAAGTTRQVMLLYLVSRKATPRKNKLKAAADRKEEKAAAADANTETPVSAPTSAAESVAALRVRWKKEAEKRLGAVVAISHDPDKRFCPITWVRVARSFRDQRATALLHQMHSPKQMKAGTLRNLVQVALTAAGFDGKPFGMHSARRGGATAAARNKLPVSLLKRLGGWKSDTVFLYLDADLEDLLTASDATLVSKTR